MSAEEFFATLAMTKLCITSEVMQLMSAHYTDVLTEEKPHEKYERFDIDNFPNVQC